MDRLPRTTSNTSLPENPSPFAPIAPLTPPSHSDSAATSRESASSTTPSTSPAIFNSSDSTIAPARANHFSPPPSTTGGLFEGRSISAPTYAISPHLRSRILADTPGTPLFATEAQQGTLHPSRAFQIAQRRRPTSLPNIPPPPPSPVITPQSSAAIRRIFENTPNSSPSPLPIATPKRTD